MVEKKVPSTEPLPPVGVSTPQPHPHVGMYGEPAGNLTTALQENADLEKLKQFVEHRVARFTKFIAVHEVHPVLPYQSPIKCLEPERHNLRGVFLNPLHVIGSLVQIFTALIVRCHLPPKSINDTLTPIYTCTKIFFWLLCLHSAS